MSLTEQPEHALAWLAWRPGEWRAGCTGCAWRGIVIWKTPQEALAIYTRHIAEGWKR